MKSSHKKVLQILGNDLRALCEINGLQYPRDVDFLLRHGIESFPIEDLTIRSQNCLKAIFRDYGTRDIKTIAICGGFLIGNLFRIRNCGTKSVVELIRTGLGSGNMRKIQIDSALETVERSESVPGQDLFEVELFPNLDFIHSYERRELKASCDALGYSYPRDVNLIFRDHVQFFTENVGSVRLTNVLKRELKSRGLFWNPEGFSKLTSMGFFQIESLEKLRGIGRKTVNELVLLITPVQGRPETVLTDTPLNTEFIQALFGSHYFSNRTSDVIDTFVVVVHELLFEKERDQFNNELNARVKHEVASGLWIDKLLWFFSKLEVLLTNLDLQGWTRRRSKRRSSYSKTVLNQIRSLEVIVLRGRGETLEEIGLKFDLTRERIRQIHRKAEKSILRNLRSREIREFLDQDFSSLSNAQQGQVRLLKAIFGLSIEPKRIEPAKLKSIRRFFGDSPTANLDEIHAFLSRIGLQHELANPFVFERLKVSLNSHRESVILKVIEESVTPMSMEDLCAELPEFRREIIFKSIPSLIRKEKVQPIGRQGLYRGAKDSQLTTDELTYAGFTITLIKSDTARIWTIRELLREYQLETSLVPNQRSFISSIKASRVAKNAGINIFSDCFVIDQNANPRLCEKFSNSNLGSLSQNLRRLDWDEIDEGNLRFLARSLAARTFSDLEVVELFLEERLFVHSQNQQDLSANIKPEILQRLQQIAAENEDHENPLYLIHKEVERISDETLSFSECVELLHLLRNQGFWLK